MPDRTKARFIKIVLHISKYMPTRLLCTPAGTTDVRHTTSQQHPTPNVLLHEKHKGDFPFQMPC